MLHSEFFNEWGKQAVESGPCFGVPPSLSAEEIEYAIALYGRDEFDSICSGVDRHARFVAWVRKNYSLIARDVETERARMMAALMAKAQSRPLDVRR